MTIDVLIADDQDLVRAGFAAILDAQPDITVVAQASHGTTAIDLTLRHSPQIALLDIRMPGKDGLAAARTICAETATKVIMLTTYDADEYVYDALRVGASGFLLKDMRRDDLINAVRVVASGEALLAPSVTRRFSPIIAVCRQDGPQPHASGRGAIGCRATRHPGPAHGT